MEQLAPGIHRFTMRHPEWHPGEWGAQVASFAVTDNGRTFLVDPLVARDDGWSELDDVVTGDVAVLITIPYHVRSAEACARRYGATIWGHRNCVARLGDDARFRELAPGSEPAGVRAFHIGSPRRSEMPLLLEGHRALVFGDALVGVPGRDGPLRVWIAGDVDERWYRGRFLPTLRPLADVRPRHVLVTHGPSVLDDGAAQLHRALRRKPWFHRG
jgi:hypothetical protein